MIRRPGSALRPNRAGDPKLIAGAHPRSGNFFILWEPHLS
ncbi:hypothetical protein FHS83_000606 [Rhizomicrobium palustre]|uniref:Uncharacterized protein n=1 Tax=Rhizomicrobium palustre TaxID=189966 RepID=A0A846MUU2_9PROT|nr:hypothetical protein [Rhizomicrobium palustre]